MTNPIQTEHSQQQGQFASQSGQQQYYDDILGGEDIFANIPEIEEDLPYGDMLEKKYKFEKIPEPEEVIDTPQKIITQPTQEPKIEEIAKNEEDALTQAASIEETKLDSLLDTKLQTDVQKKFGELFFMTKRIYELKSKLGIDEESFDIVGADNDKIFILYRFFLDESHTPIIFITKIEQNKETEEETSNELKFTFNEENASLEVMINDTLLFDEIKDFTEDPKKKMQVSEKMNKFIFLASEEQKKLEKEIQIKEEEERERKRLQDIFRNF